MWWQCVWHLMMNGHGMRCLMVHGHMMVMMGVMSKVFSMQRSLMWMRMMRHVVWHQMIQSRSFESGLRRSELHPIDIGFEILSKAHDGRKT